MTTFKCLYCSSVFNIFHRRSTFPAFLLENSNILLLEVLLCLQVFIKHTSASLTLNENADPTVRVDFESHFNKMVPEDMPYYKHDYEGSDDMPAHIKSSLLGSSVVIPITNGRLNMGTWQGIYLCEHRNYGGSRKLVLTAYGI